MVDGEERQAFYSTQKEKWFDADTFNGLDKKAVRFWREITKKHEAQEEQQLAGQMSVDDFLGGVT